LHGGTALYAWTVLENHVALLPEKRSRALTYAHVHARYTCEGGARGWGWVGGWGGGGCLEDHSTGDRRPRRTPRAEAAAYAMLARLSTRIT
jgi:hypothetical protein